MAIHPQAAAVLATLPDIWRDPAALKTLTAAEARAMSGGDAGDEPPAPPAQVAVEEVQIPGPEAPLRALVYRPARPRGSVLWIGGGGFVFPPLGQPGFAAALASAADCVVVLADYRLAPERPYPAALDDSDAALRWVAAHASELGGDPTNLAVGGQSAGGNLAAALTLLARERGGPEIGFQALVQPMLSRTFTGTSKTDREIGALAWSEAIEWLWQQYIGDSDGSDPLACPLGAAKLAGLPPALIQTAEYDVLRDEGQAYARRLSEEGVAVEYTCFEGMFHGFEDWPESIDAARECVGAVGAAIRRAFPSDDASPTG